MVRAVALYEAGILSLFAVLRKTRFDKNKPFQPRDVLQELIFIESGASQSWLRRCPPPDNFLHFGKTWEMVVTHAVPARDAFLQPRSLLRELVTADSWVQGTWLSRKDWLASRIVAVDENNLLLPHLVLHKEMKPNLMMQACKDQTAPPATVRLSEFFWSLAINWTPGSCSDTLRKGSLRAANLRTVQLRFHRVPRNVNSSSSFFARRSSAQLRESASRRVGPCRHDWLKADTGRP